ncbi:MAG: response regulator transcription factor [Chloroflexi bacterium]|nr:response regulator transcription factor [Chloroflexota bacterium]
MRLLVVAASSLARAGLAALLKQSAVLSVAATHDGGADLATAIQVYRPAVIVWDVGWDPAAHLERLADISDLEVPVLAMLGLEAADTISQLLTAGVRGVLREDATIDQLTTTITALVQGLTVIHPTFIEIALASVLTGTAPDPDPAIDALTPREREVLNLIAEGLPNKTIAAQLGISEHTVKFHVNAILTKLGAQSRTEAVVRATRAGMIAL